jgi:hypothetical protein
MSLQAYPTVFPLEAAGILVTKLKGVSAETTAKILHAAWEVQGYAQSQLLPDVIAPAPVLSREQLVANLDLCVKGDRHNFRSIDWKAIIQALLIEMSKVLLAEVAL